MTTPWQQHVERWRGCQGCELHQRRKRVVLARGSVPCDVLFVGEAPGASEDAIGAPFVGPAGKLLDEIIEEAMSGLPPLRIAFTNLVCCIPRGEDWEKIGEPGKEHIAACRKRLEEFVALARPRLIVLVGSLAKRHSSGLVGSRSWAEIDHPAFIMRMNEAQRGLARQRAEVRIRNAVGCL